MSSHEREAEIPEDLKKRAREVMAQFSEPTQESYEKQIADLRAQLAAAEKRAIDLEAHLVEVRWAWVDYKAYLEKKYPPVEPNAFTFTCPHHQKIHALLGADFPARAQAVAEVLAKSEVLARGLNEAWNRNNGREKLFDVQGIGPLVNLARGIIAALDKEQ